MKILTRSSIPLLLLLAASTVGAATVMYRFSNENGDPVYSYTLPSAQVKHGYQKIDARTGQVIESVAPQLAPEELAERLRMEQAMQECRDELERIYNLYGTERDIDHALEDTMTSLNNRITQLQANLQQAARELGRLQSQAADVERAGREMPPRLLRSIDRSRAQIEAFEGEVEQRQWEQDQARLRHRRELARFRDGTCPEPGTLAEASSP
jgi:chromosome segregation ATPase